MSLILRTIHFWEQERKRGGGGKKGREKPGYRIKRTVIYSRWEFVFGGHIKGGRREEERGGRGGEKGGSNPVSSYF